MKIEISVMELLTLIAGFRDLDTSHVEKHILNAEDLRERGRQEQLKEQEELEMKRKAAAG